MSSRGARGIGWWITAILAPIGIVGGPLEIANATAGLIEWRGPIAYVVRLWESTVGHASRVIADALSGLLHLPSFPNVVVDYVTLGLLWLLAAMRAFTLAEQETNPPLGSLRFYAYALFLAALWPLLTAGMLALVFAGIFRLKPMERQQALVASLWLAPFALFLVLWAINVLWGP